MLKKYDAHQEKIAKQMKERLKDHKHKFEAHEHKLYVAKKHTEDELRDLMREG